MPTKVNIEQEEQKIFKEFEEKGWKYKFADYGYGINQLIFRKPTKEYIYHITIYLKEHTYYFDFGLDAEIHQLLHKLFELWGWFDE